MNKLHILIVDDSKMMRDLYINVLNSQMQDIIIDTAENGKEALTKISTNKYDVITLDLNMPVMNGVEFMKARKKARIEIPVIIFSSIAHSGASWTIECLELGAADFLLKPRGAREIQALAGTLVKLIQLYGRRHARLTRNADFFKSKISDKDLATKEVVQDITRVEQKNPTLGLKDITPLRETGSIDIIAIGISTGGPNALRELLPNISPNLRQPILIVQHMPVGFTQEFATSLNNICPLEVKEAQDGDILKAGRVFIAPGDKHIIVEKKALATIIRLSDEPERNGHKPSADVLFESIAKVYTNKALGIIMTGMGRDGAAQLAEMYKQGAATIGQDEESSVVYGMPRVAYEMGAVQQQLPLHKIAETINEICL